MILRSGEQIDQLTHLLLERRLRGTSKLSILARRQMEGNELTS